MTMILSKLVYNFLQIATILLLSFGYHPDTQKEIILKNCIILGLVILFNIHRFKEFSRKKEKNTIGKDESEEEELPFLKSSTTAIIDDRLGSKRRLVKLTLFAAFSFILSILVLVFTSDMYRKCVESDSHDTAVCLAGAQSFSKDVYFKELAMSSTNSDDDDASSLVIVTAASTSFMVRLRNLVGSVHLWEPSVTTVIYDLGLNESDLQEIASWKQVSVIPFPFDSYPPHVKLLYNFAWKIVLLEHAISHYEKFIFLDSGLELLRPLEGVRYYLDTESYFSSIATNSIGLETHPTVYDNLNKILQKNPEVISKNIPPINADDIKQKPFCRGGIQGFVQGTAAESLILKPAIECALDENCIAPKGSGRDNHNYDQSILSVLAHATGFGHLCRDKDTYSDPNTWHYTTDETRCNGLEIGCRRWRGPRRYGKHIRFETKAETTNKIKMLDEEFKSKSRSSVTEVTTGKKPQAGSKWHECELECTDTYNRMKQDSQGKSKDDESMSKKEYELKETWSTCINSCSKDQNVRKRNVDEVDGVFFEYLTYFIKGATLSCVNYRIYTFLLSLSCFLMFFLVDRKITKNDSTTTKKYLPLQKK